MQSNEETWPVLEYAGWQDSCATLHLLTQIVGKIRLAHAPLVNHWWQVPLYVTSRGLTTSAMPHGIFSGSNLIFTISPTLFPAPQPLSRMLPT